MSSLRAYGMSCDNLLAATVVLANGSVVEASGSSDLFWSLQGAGGGNYGVVVDITMKAHQAPDIVSLYAVAWNSSAALILQTWEAFFLSHIDDTRLTPQIVVMADLGVHSTWLFLGSASELQVDFEIHCLFSIDHCSFCSPSSICLRLVFRLLCHPRFGKRLGWKVFCIWMVATRSRRVPRKLERHRPLKIKCCGLRKAPTSMSKLEIGLASSNCFLRTPAARSIFEES